jgi:dTDP-4-dehydrorhamnose reductase
MKSCIIIFGATGILGKELVKNLDNLIEYDPSYKDIIYHVPTRKECDITIYDNVYDYINKIQPDIILHLAGQTMDINIEGKCLDESDAQNTDKIKDNKQYRNTIRQTNIQGTLNIVSVCDDKDIKLIYTSTDSVFKGDVGNYTTDSELKPKTIYGKSKCCGEMMVSTLPRHLIIRAPFVRSSKFEFKYGYTDMICSREYVNIVAPDILSSALSHKKGIIHIVGRTQSMYDIGKYTSKNVIPCKMPEDKKRVLSQNCSMMHW